MPTTACGANAASLPPDRAFLTMIVVDQPSPNHAPRPDGGVVDILVLHYTELPLQESLDILRDGAREHRVSSHYVLAEDGTAYRLVPEDRVAWHAGQSHWRGREALNATSIGVEIVNLHGDRHDYPPRQIAALIDLCKGILARHPAIEPRNVVGHSDIAPKRKIDPGLRFPWATLAAAGVGLWPNAGGRPLDGDFHKALQRFGYAPPIAVPPKDIVKAFQRHFRPAQVDGMPDPETRARLAGLLDQVGGAA
jgi:N-acetylmuramoyl-L-alanine amidase